MSRTFGNGRLPTTPERTQPHPGIKGYNPPFAIPHAPIPLSLQPQAIEGVPRRTFFRAGVRPAFSVLSATPPAFAYLLGQLRKRPGAGVGANVLIARTQAPIGKIG